MATSTPSKPASGAAASDHKTRAHRESGKTKLDRIQAKVRENAHAAGTDLARHLHDFERTNARQVARAKRAIKADVTKVRKATAKLGDKFRKDKK